MQQAYSPLPSWTIDHVVLVKTNNNPMFVQRVALIRLVSRH